MATCARPAISLGPHTRPLVRQVRGHQGVDRFATRFPSAGPTAGPVPPGTGPGRRASPHGTCGR